MIIFLDISVEDAMKRGEFGQERYEKKDIQERVRELFHEMKEDNWKVRVHSILSSSSPDSVGRS